MKYAQFSFNNHNLRIAIWLIFGFITSFNSSSQVLPANSIVDWSKAGVQGGIPQVSTVYNVLTTTLALVADGVTDNTANLQALLNDNTTYPSPCVFYFPAGTYLFKSTVFLTSGRVLRGESPSTTLFHFNLGTANVHCIDIVSRTAGTLTNVTAGSSKGSNSITVADVNLFQPGNWAQIKQSNDPAIMGTNNPIDWDVSWSAESVGQLFKVTSVAGNVLTLDRPLRFDFYAPPGGGTLRARTLLAIENVGFENFKVKRVKNQSTASGYTFFFNYAANCWIKNIESDSTLTAHVLIEQSTNIEIRDSYFHRAYNYGGGGNGYGVGAALQCGSILVENNIFQRLRHATLVSSGASGNVFAYNYSIDPVWDLAGIPSDVSLHGHFPFMNLFEGNIVQKVSNSDYWGPSGPGNTLFRNRIEGNDIINMDNASNQNYIGNELLGSYKFDIRSGTGLIIHGNNLGGTITYDPTYGTLLSNSMYLTEKPAFFGNLNWPAFGPPNAISTGTIPAIQRFLASDTGMPTNFTVSAGVVTATSLELLLKATDSSDMLKYSIIFNGTTTELSGNSDIVKTHRLIHLTPNTSYTFSVSVKDFFGNEAANSPLQIIVSTTAVTNTECQGTDYAASNGSFITGYNYSFKTIGTDVITTFELLDNRTGVQGYAWTYNPNFAESTMTANGKIVTKTFSGQTLGAMFKMACKFAYAGGMSVTKQFTYTVGNNCESGVTDTQLPTAFTATKGAVNANSVELLLNATDNSGNITYTITYDTTTLTTSGKSATLKSHVVTGLTASTNYSFSVMAKDAAGNVAFNSPVIVAATTTNSLVSVGVPTIDFETVGKDWTWTIYENGDNAASLFTFVDNPAISGINSSVTCARFIVNANAANWAQVQTTGISPITFTADNNKVKVMVNKSVISNFVITLQNADATVKLQKYAPNTKINEWELMTFDFSDLIGKTVTKMIVYPDYPSARTTGSINYFDNIFFNSLTNDVIEIATSNIHLYPNPVIDVLHIQLPANNNRFTIYDIVGNKVFDKYISDDYQLDMSNLKTGIYFLKVENAEGIKNGKVIKQ
jgi:hypothetical protein